MVRAGGKMTKCEQEPNSKKIGLEQKGQKFELEHKGQKFGIT